MKKLLIKTLLLLSPLVFISGQALDTRTDNMVMTSDVSKVIQRNKNRQVEQQIEMYKSLIGVNLSEIKLRLNEQQLKRR